MIQQIAIGVLSSAALGACAYLMPKSDVVEVDPTSYARVYVEGETATAAEKAACDAAGGEVRKDGLRGLERCVQAYPDAGKTCRDEDDCLGGCHAEDMENVDFGAKMTGVCEADDSPFGCFTTIADGRAEAALCVD